MRLRSWWSVHVCVSLALAAACGDAKKEIPGGSGPPTSAVVGPEGGTVEHVGLSLEIPPGALAEEVEISIARSSDAPSGDFVRLSPVFRFEPDGLAFAVPATVRFPLPEGARAPGIYWASAGAPFQRIGGTVVDGAISGEVSHFSAGFVGDPPETGGGDLRPVAARTWPIAGGGGYFQPWQIDATPDGGVLVGGEYGGDVELGGGVAPPGSSGWMIVRFAPDGTARWAKQIVGASTNFGACGARPDGGAVVAAFKNIVGLRADGTDDWRLDVKGGGEIWPSSVAVDDEGRVAVVGVLNGSVDLGSGPLRSENGQGAFLAILGSDGKLRHLAAHGPVDEGSVIHDIVVPAPGGFLVAGIYTEAVDLGGGALPAPPMPRFTQNLHLARFDSSGAHRWSVAVEVKSGTVKPASLAVDDTGRIALLADYDSGSVDLGDGPLSADRKGGLVLFSFDPEDGRRLGTPTVVSGARALGRPSRGGSLYVSGKLDVKQVDFGGGLVPAIEPEIDGAGYVAIFGADLSHRSSLAWPAWIDEGPPARMNDVQSRGIVPGPDGGVWWLAMYRGETDLGGGFVLNDLQRQSVALVRFAP